MVNLGGALAITGQEALGWSPAVAEDRVETAIATALRDVFAHAERDQITTDEAARMVAQERLTSGEM